VIHVHVGEQIRVHLSGSPAMPWTPVTSSNDRTVQRTSSAVIDGTASATFVARKVGTADLSSTEHPTCRDVTPPCGAPDRYWVAHVIVE
jgi:hypothetical protein